MCVRVSVSHFREGVRGCVSHVRSHDRKITGLFAKEPDKRDDILQKRPIILRSLRLCVCVSYVTSHDRMGHVEGAMNE